MGFVQAQDQVAMKLLGDPGAIGSREFRYRQRPFRAHKRGTAAEPEDSERDCRQRHPVSFHRPPAVGSARSVRFVQGSTQIPSTARVEASASGFGFWYSRVTNSMRTRFPTS